MSEPNARLTLPPLALALPSSASSYARRSQLRWDLSNGAEQTTMKVLVERRSVTGRAASRQRTHEPFWAGTRMTGVATALDKTDWLVGQLQQLARTRALQYTVEVGRLIVAHLFDGNLEALRERGRADVSYRRLAQRPDLPFSPVTLWRCVKIYELVERFPSLLSKQHLALAHLRAVASLPPPAQQLLLERAEAQAWTSDELVKAVRSNRQQPHPKPRALARSARRLRQLAQNLEAELDAAPEQLRLSAGTRDALLRVRNELATLEVSLDESARRSDKRRPTRGYERTSGVHRVDPNQVKPDGEGN